MYLVSISISSFENCLPASPPGLLTGLFVFLVLNGFSSVHVLETNPSPDEQMPSIFPHSVGCLFTLAFWSLVFSLGGTFCFNLIHFYSPILAVISGLSHPIQRVTAIPSILRLFLVISSMFSVSSLMLESTLWFGLTFLKGERSGVSVSIQHLDPACSAALLKVAAPSNTWPPPVSPIVSRAVQKLLSLM